MEAAAANCWQPDKVARVARQAVVEQKHLGMDRTVEAEALHYSMISASVAVEVLRAAAEAQIEAESRN